MVPVFRSQWGKNIFVWIRSDRLFEAARNAEQLVELKEETIVTMRLIETLRCGGLRVLVRLLRKYFIERGEQLNIARNKVIRFTKFAFVSSCRAPTLNDQPSYEFVEFVDDAWKVIKWDVATKLFYDSREVRYESVHVSGEKHEKRSVIGCGSEKTIGAVRRSARSSKSCFVCIWKRNLYKTRKNDAWNVLATQERSFAWFSSMNL